MKTVNEVTFCALISALSVALMFLGSIFCYASLLVAACCGYLNLIVANETKLSRAFCCYFIVLFLASLFVARKSILIDYAIFSGIYPIIEVHISKIENLIFKLMFKFSVFLICSFSMISFNLFLMGLNNMPLKKVKAVGYAAMLAWCFCFDYFLQDVKKIYIMRIRPKLLKQLN